MYGKKAENDMDFYDEDRYLADCGREPAFFIQNSVALDGRMCTDACIC